MKFLLISIFLVVVVFVFLIFQKVEIQESLPEENNSIRNDQLNGIASLHDTVQKEKQEEPFNCEETLADSPFYQIYSSQSGKAEKDLRAQGKDDIADMLQHISCVPQGIWVSGQNREWQLEHIREIIDKAKQEKKIPVFVVYDGPNHNDASWRHVGSGTEYQQWIQELSQVTKSAAIWVILEPDALSLAQNFSKEDRRMRFEELYGAVVALKTQNSNARVYIDAGHSNWRSADIVAEYLQQSGIQFADGFSLNVANHQSLESEISYGMKISDLLSDKHFVIDVGQNGAEVQGSEWCNAKGRALGTIPGIATQYERIDAFLWVKPPGESDGMCNGGPPAGKFWLEYALELIKNQ